MSDESETISSSDSSAQPGESIGPADLTMVAETDPLGGSSRPASSRLHSTESYFGPIPPPDILRQYDAIMPGSAKSIIRGYVKQRDHRMTMESSVVTTNNKAKLRAQIIAGFLGFFITTCGTLLVYHGHDWAGTTIIVSGLGTVLTAFLADRRSHDKELERKAEIQSKLAVKPPEGTI